MDHTKIWSTDLVAARHRLDYWVGAVCEAFLKMHITSARNIAFQARLEAVRLDTLVLNCVSATAQHVYRRKKDIVRSSDNYYYLLYNHGAAWQVQQNDVGGCLLSGDMTLVDSRQSYQFLFSENCSVLSIQMPIGWLESWLSEPGMLLGRRINGQQGWGLSLGSLLRQLSPAEVSRLPLPERLIADQIGSLLCLAGQSILVSESVNYQEVSTVRDLASRIEEGIRSRFMEPGLTASSIADELDISVRTLHRHLGAQGRTFADCLMLERITVAQRMLQSPAHTRLSISEIGYRVGLVDPSHFSRVYKRLMGQLPSQTRNS